MLLFYFEVLLILQPVTTLVVRSHRIALPQRNRDISATCGNGSQPLEDSWYCTSHTGPVNGSSTCLNVRSSYQLHFYYTSYSRGSMISYILTNFVSCFTQPGYIPSNNRHRLRYAVCRYHGGHLLDEVHFLGVLPFHVFPITDVPR